MEPHEVETFWAKPSASEQIQYLCEWAHVQQYDRNIRSKAWVDFIFHLMTFSKQKFDISKTSCLLDIMKQVFEHATVLPEGSEQWATLEENYTLFSTLIKQHSDVFSASDVEAIVDYTTNTYFQQFRVIQYLFKHPPKHRIRRIERVIEAPLTPLSLSSASIPLKKELDLQQDLRSPEVVD